MMNEKQAYQIGVKCLTDLGFNPIGHGEWAHQDGRVGRLATRPSDFSDPDSPPAAVLLQTRRPSFSLIVLAEFVG